MSFLAGFLVAAFVHSALFALLWRYTVRNDQLTMEAQSLVIEQLELQLAAEVAAAYGKSAPPMKYSSEELKDRNILWAAANRHLRSLK